MKKLKDLVSAVDVLAMQAAASRSDADLEEMIQVCARQSTRLQALVAEHVAVMADRQAGDASGSREPAEFLKKKCHYSGREAAALSRDAQVLKQSLPVTREALKRGEVTWSHARAVVRAVDQLGVEEVADREAHWIGEVAAQRGPERLQRLIRARVYESAPGATVDCADRRRRTRELKLILRDNAGYDVRGYLSLEEGVLIKQITAVSGATELDAVMSVLGHWLHGDQGPIRAPGGPRLRLAADEVAAVPQEEGGRRGQAAGAEYSRRPQPAACV
ncbi:DUF222 domain-containing protein [Kutzneria albida]|uniref:DUF222 domain-containing protein n=1 Tax=Kutzneria albida DSM 43870 TaxID=1449976 RepID=W5WID2_9PSEU|nr:DUF222 domain-containing protein [Kutzneria albida]AHI00613.1 hypothetical protein KALB_7255 [Kutzneria albida DSM 43870]